MVYCEFDSFAEMLDYFRIQNAEDRRPKQAMFFQHPSTRHWVIVEGDEKEYEQPKMCVHCGGRLEVTE